MTKKKKVPAQRKSTNRKVVTVHIRKHQTLVEKSAKFIERI